MKCSKFSLSLLFFSSFIYCILFIYSLFFPLLFLFVLFFVCVKLLHSVYLLYIILLSNLLFVCVCVCLLQCQDLNIQIQVRLCLMYWQSLFITIILIVCEKECMCFLRTKTIVSKPGHIRLYSFIYLLFNQYLFIYLLIWPFIFTSKASPNWETKSTSHSSSKECILINDKKG